MMAEWIIDGVMLIFRGGVEFSEDSVQFIC